MLTKNKTKNQRSKIKNGLNTDGFAAMIAVILIASGVLAFSLVSISSALLYADGVNQREYRIQARLNASSCLDVATLMVAKDYFMNGTTTISKFGCNISVGNDFSGNVSLDVVAEFLGIKTRGERILKVNNNGVITIL